MAAEAFDPFSNDDDDAFLPNVSSRDDQRGDAHGSPQRSASSNVASQASDPSLDHVNSSHSSQRNNQTEEIMQEFVTAFPSMTLNDETTTDQFGFPSSCFSATFENTSGEDHTKANNKTSQQSHPTDGNLEGTKFIITEEMSVIHESKTNQCTVKIRGNLTLEVPPHDRQNQRISCDISFLDPENNLDTVTSENYDCAQPIASADDFLSLTPSPETLKDTAFRISMPELNGEVDSWFGRPLIEYECGDKLRPVPMLVNTSIQEFNDQCQISYHLRVNPRNDKPLVNAVVLVSVPDEFDGANARVCSVGRTIGKGNIDTNWSGITRILSWKLGELYSGAICEFEALFSPSSVESVQNEHESSSQVDTKFPVLLRYDSAGCLLSNVDLDFGEGSKPPSVERKFRVYHREI